ncbi:MAG: hypothetical protein GY830_05820 [Bacteroidetes bacterium]|nr:hypothetical protein [Bacteroidota bacterium]
MLSIYNINSNAFSLDHFIVYVFLILMLLVGIYAGKKIKSIREYSIGNRNFGTGVLVLTLLATWIGGSSSTGLAGAVFKDGIIMLLPFLAGSLSVLLVGYLVIPRMISFEKNDYSMADIIGRFYGENAKIFAGFTGFVSSIIVLGAQILALGLTFEFLLGMKKINGILFGGGILVLYTSFGGIKSVAITDVLEFIILIVIIPIVANLAINKAGGITNVLNNLPKSRFEVFSHSNFRYYFVLFFICLFPIYSLAPISFQRILMAKSRKQMKKILLLQAVISAVFFIMISLIGFAAYIINPKLDYHIALPYTIKYVLPIGLRGFAIAGLLAVIMSTGDSILNIGGIFLIHNTVNPILKKFNTKFNELFLIKLATLLIGAIAMLIAYYGKDIIKLDYYAASIFSVTIIVPFVAALLGLKGNSKTFFISALLSIISFFVAKLIIGDIDISIIISLSVNFISFLGLHILKNKKFTFIERTWHEEQELEESITLKKLKKSVISTIPTPNNILKYCTKTIRRYGSNHIMFGAFFCINYIVPIFMWNHQFNSNVHFMTILRFIGGLLSVGLILEKQWPFKLKKFFPIYWYLTVAYCLPFVSTAMFILMGGSTEWLINISLTIMLLAWLIDWRTFIILLISGTSLGILFGHYYSENSFLQLLNFDQIYSIYLLIYTIFFACLIGITFFRKKDNDIRNKLSTLKLMGGSMAHEVKNVLGIDSSNSMFLTMLLDSLEVTEDKDKVLIKTDKNTFKKIRELISTMGMGNEKGLEVIKRILTNMTEDIKENEFKLINIKDAINNVINKYDLTDAQKANIEIDIKDNFNFMGSEFYFRHVIFNLLKNAYKFAREDCKIKIWTENNKLFFQDNGPGISNEDYPYIFDYFFTTTSAASGIGLAFSKMVMEKMRSTIDCKTKTGKDSFTTFIINFKK